MCAFSYPFALICAASVVSLFAQSCKAEKDDETMKSVLELRRLRKALMAPEPEQRGQPISHIATGDDRTVTVRITQNLFGNFEDCYSPDPSIEAMLMFAVYTPANFKEKYCFIERDVNPCWAKNIRIACDPLTNTATIDLYVRDEIYSARAKVPNPYVGNCYGDAEILTRTVKFSQTFECKAPLPITCSSDADCTVGNWCAPGSLFSDPTVCKPYANVGDSCGGNVPSGTESKCNPTDAICLETFSCMGGTDFPGKCVAHGGACKSSSDCTAAEYCDGVCKPLRKEHECCEPSTAPCESGFDCTTMDMFGSPTFVCQ